MTLYSSNGISWLSSAGNVVMSSTLRTSMIALKPSRGVIIRGSRAFRAAQVRGLMNCTP
jgi:hypothetical protein